MSVQNQPSLPATVMWAIGALVAVLVIAMLVNIP